MYMRVLLKEDDFYPLNRVDIEDRYIAEVLRRPSDAYFGTFNAKNKMDIMSGFVFKLFSEERSWFEESEWLVYCVEYQRSTLTEFDAKQLLSDYLSARVVSGSGSTHWFKYSFFYTFFVGRYVSAHPTVLETFLAEEGYLRLQGVVEVITGLRGDNTDFVSALTEKLAGHLTEFYQVYLDEGFDPLSSVRWRESDEDDERVFEQVSRQIEAGPRAPEEVDALKQSLSSEARTADQEVRFQKLFELEVAMFSTANALAEAVRNSDDVPGDLKKVAVAHLLRTHLVVTQVGAVLSPAIAKRRWVRWGGIGFLNLDPDECHDGDVGDVGDGDGAVQSAALGKTGVLWVIEALSRMVAKRAGEHIATRKLGQVFRAIEEESASSGYPGFLMFTCILHARPTGWKQTLNSMIIRTDRNSYYLREMLELLLKNYREEVNQNRDREAIKDLVALIRAKRTYKTEAPGAKAVADILRRMESKRLFDKLDDPKVD
jgi:hypothetical protein